jgi:hypothetical protein
MKLWRLLVPLVVLLAVAVLPACASSSITYMNIAAYGPATPYWNQPLTVPQFDPSLGFLYSVTLTLNGYAEGTITAVNEGANPGDIFSSLSVPITAADTLGHTLAETDLDHSWTDYGVAAGGGVPHTWAGEALSDTEDVVTRGGNLAYFTGLGDATINVESKGFISDFDIATLADYAGNAPVTLSSSASLDLTYQYGDRPLPTPEPGSLALLGLGLPMVGLWFRRRK